MAESTFVAAEGVLNQRAVLTVITTYLLYRNSAAFQGLHGPYPIAWRDMTVILGATFGASNPSATLGPAKRASRMPARRSQSGSPTDGVGTMPRAVSV